MIQDSRLPQNNKEGLLFGVIICGITVILMSTLNISLNFVGSTTELLITIIKGIPLFFVIAMLIEGFLVHPIASRMVNKFTTKQDSFNAQILFNVFFTVIGMSFFMTIVGDFIGHGFSFSSGLLTRFLAYWPRNFGIVLLLELIIAQPLARKVMVFIHQKNK